MNEIEVSIITPMGVFFHDDVVSVTVRGAEGWLSIHYDHTPLITPIVPGELTIRKKEDKPMAASVSHGFLDAEPKKVTIISEQARWVQGNSYPNR